MANWYVRKGGSDSNGGSSTSLTPDRSGTNMSTTNGSTQVTSATAAFTAGDVGKGLNVAGVCHRIATYTNATTVQLDRVYAGTTGTNRAWAIGGALLTVNKILSVGFTSVWQGGDSVYVGAGVYREVLNNGSVWSPSLNIVGDTDGSRTGDSGEVQVTAYLTNDKTAPSSTTLILTNGGISYSNMVFVGGSGNPKIVATGNSSNITFTNCAFLGLYPLNVFSISHTITSAVDHNILFDRCYMLLGGGVSLNTATNASADYDCGITYRNCYIDVWGGNVFTVGSTGALAFKGGGGEMYNCTARSSAPIVAIGTADKSSTFPFKVENCYLQLGMGTVALSATTLGQITERNNLINSSPAPRTNVAAGTGSISDGSYAPLIHFGQEAVWGGQTRTYGTPAPGSPLLGFGASGNGPSIDITGAARPAGGGSSAFAAGAFERGNTFVRETTTVQAGTSGLKCVGPGYQDFLVPVNPQATTVSVYLRYDSTYAGTRPQMAVLGGTECGVADASVTVSTSGLNAFAQVSLTFTPTAKGIVTIRLISNDTNGAGTVYADTFAVT